MEEPITPKEINDPIKPTIKGPLYDEAVRFVNEAIANRNFHRMITQKEEVIANYNAILQSPYEKYNSVMPLVVENFKVAGWDCFFDSAYDARGPHHCFYVNKKHFDGSN